MSFLNQFSEADLQAALEDVDMDPEAGPAHKQSTNKQEDSEDDSEDDLEDDIPLAEQIPGISNMQPSMAEQAAKAGIEARKAYELATQKFWES
jgi:hypothetical protein